MVLEDWTLIVARRYVKKWRKLTKNGVDQFGSRVAGDILGLRAVEISRIYNMEVK